MFKTTWFGSILWFFAKLFLIAGIAIGILLVLISEGWSAWDGPRDPVISHWFQSLTVPGSTMSCCDYGDGHRLALGDVRVGEKGYEVRIFGQWLPVPAKAVLQRTSNPTGAPVVFIAPWDGRTILCFVRGPDV